MRRKALLNYAIDRIRQLRWSSGNELCHVGNYVRELPVSLDRMYENALDGEHLPHLHRSSFSYIEILDSGSWGWHAKAGMYPRGVLTDMELKLVLDREESCWKTTTLAGVGKGTEIWTHAIPLGPNAIRVIVDFYVPNVPSFAKKLYLESYRTTYAKLYDEDLAMMSQRQASLDFSKSRGPTTLGEKDLRLGHESDVCRSMPYVFEYENHRYCLNRVNGELIAHSAICPHMLAPIDAREVVDGIVECPWHAYRFDVKTGACVSGQSCRLKVAPDIRIDPESKYVYATRVDSPWRSRQT